MTEKENNIQNKNAFEEINFSKMPYGKFRTLLKKDKDNAAKIFSYALEPEPLFHDSLLSAITAVSNYFTLHLQKPAQLYLKYGWFPYPESPLIPDCNESVFNEVLSNYTEDHLAEIEQALCKSFPKRTYIFKDSFNAHRQEQYTLSIPIFLAQAEGISFDAFKCSPYATKNRKKFENSPHFATLKEDPLCLPLLKNDTIKASSTMVPPGALNRHAILHGASTEYPTKLNSLKAISLLACIKSLT